MRLNHKVKSIAKNPMFYTTLGLVSMACSVISAARSTPKYKLILDDIKIDNEGVITTGDKIKAGVKSYLPAILFFVGGTACIINGNWIYKSRLTSVMAALSLAENKLDKTTAKIVEKFGEEKCEEVRNEIAEDDFNSVPNVNDNICNVRNVGDELCFDAFSGRPFWSTVNKIDRAVNEINNMSMRSPFCGETVTLNDFYVELGLPKIDMGEYLGWNYGYDGMIEVRKIPRINEKGQPFILVDFVTKPVSIDVKYF